MLMSGKKIKLSVVVPIYNEEGSVVDTIRDLVKTIRKCKEVSKFEIIAVNDGSDDDSLPVLKKIRHKELLVVSRKKNKGYGSALKKGISVSNYDWVLIIDADGTYPTKEVPKLIRTLQETKSDMVVGARTKKGVKIELLRRLPKMFVLWFARFLTRGEIEDINSGMRIFNKNMAKRFWHLYPDGFSFTSTITVSSLLSGYDVCFVPIDYYKRIGKSSIKPSDFFMFLSLILRLVVYFKPMNFFFLPGLTFFIFSFCYIFYTIVSARNVTDTGILLLMMGLQFMFFGLVADLLVKNREGAKYNG